MQSGNLLRCTYYTSDVVIIAVFSLKTAKLRGAYTRKYLYQQKNGACSQQVEVCGNNNMVSAVAMMYLVTSVFNV